MINQKRIFVEFLKEKNNSGIYTSNISNNEILLSFDCNAGSGIFNDWFNNTGKEQMTEWCKNNGSSYIVCNID